MDAMQGVSHRHISDHLSELVRLPLPTCQSSKVGLFTLLLLLQLCATHYLMSWRQYIGICEDATTHSLFVLASWAKSHPCCVADSPPCDLLMP